MVALVDASRPDSGLSQFCGGTLIGSRWVLTAAHCITDGYSGDVVDASRVEALVGEEDLPNSRGNRVQVIGILRHPDYNPVALRNDFALLKLNTALPGPYMPLASSTALYPADTVATIAGWGWTLPDFAVLPTHLQEASVPIAADSVCLGELGRIFSPELMLCAGVKPTAPGANDGVSVCFGDSGGPIYVTQPDGSPVQVGVVSGGFSCSDPRVRSFFAEVASAQEFLAQRPIFPPQAINPPKVTGSPYVGSTLTCVPSNYYGDPIDTLSYSWTREGQGVGLIPGATSSTYVPTTEDLGNKVRCDVRTTNAGGSTVALGFGIPISEDPNRPTNADSIAPTSSLLSGRCNSSRCEIRVSASDNVGVVAVTGTAVRTYSSTCRVGRRRTSCSKVDTVAIEARTDASGNWVTSAPLVRGRVQNLTVSLRASDEAGNIQSSPTTFSRRLRGR